MGWVSGKVGPKPEGSRCLEGEYTPQHPAQALAVNNGRVSNPPDALNFLLAKLNSLCFQLLTHEMSLLSPIQGTSLFFSFLSEYYVNLISYAIAKPVCELVPPTTQIIFRGSHNTGNTLTPGVLGNKKYYCF